MPQSVAEGHLTCLQEFNRDCRSYDDRLVNPGAKTKKEKEK